MNETGIVGAPRWVALLNLGRHTGLPLRQDLGDKEFDSVMAFFHNAEAAIEKEDIEGLMALYSDQYSNGEHDKKAARAIWSRIFQTFDNMAAKHNMRIEVYAADSLIVRCSGLLMGLAKGEKYPITIDSWVEQDHILVKEGSTWKLAGTTGKDRKRLWFDKPMHPLF